VIETQLDKLDSPSGVPDNTIIHRYFRPASNGNTHVNLFECRRVIEYKGKLDQHFRLPMVMVICISR